MATGPDFPKPIIDALAKRANLICSKPDCRIPTGGPHRDPAKSRNVGEAAHIKGARDGSARYDPEMTDEQRRDISNGIWLCRTHAREIDGDEKRYPLELLHKWKREHEQWLERGKVVERASEFPFPPAIAALHQLPPPPGDFTGRTDELDDLLGKFHAGGVTIFGLRGMGGIGKTALALKLAEQLKDSYPDAQIYLDLRGMSPQPLTATDAQAHVLRAYQPTARLPESEAELRGLYNSVLHNQRALLVMDNAASGQQIAPLIPPAGCALIVTSRFRFTVPGLYAKEIGTLPREDARKLLLAIAPRIGEEAQKISKLCGRLPLALRLAASALAERINISPKDFVRRLEQANARMGLVDASLSLSYDLLDVEMQSRWRMLGVFPASFDVEAVAGVWGVDRDEAADVLGDLVKYSLVDYEPSSDRYSLHDLARVFAESKLNEEEKSENKCRHAVHYVNVLWACLELYNQAGKGLTAGLGMFDLERDNIEAGQAWAAAASPDNGRAMALCSAYPLAGMEVLALRLHPRKLIDWHLAALTAARLLKDREAEGSHLGNLGIVYVRLGNLSEAIQCHMRQLDIAREIGDRRDEGNALCNLGVAYAEVGDLQKAIECHKQDLAIARENGDQRSEGNALGNIGLVYTGLGDLETAIECHEQNLVLARETGDRQGEANALGNLGMAHALSDDLFKAIEYHEQNLAVSREIGDLRGEAVALSNLSGPLYILGRHEQALKAAESALLIFDQIESPLATGVREMLAKWRASEQE